MGKGPLSTPMRQIGPADNDPVTDIELFRDATGMKELAAIALFLSLGACREQIEESYATWSEAQSAGAVERGWIPSFVPETAQDIRDSHDLDTNAQRLEFTIPLSDVPAMIVGLRRVSADDNTAAAELSKELRFGEASDTYVVCSRIRNGALVVDRETGQTAYDTVVRWADDDCSQAE